LFFKCATSDHFYFLSNEGLTSKFISRFIAVRLSMNYHLTEVINPIKFDLIEVMNKTSGASKLDYEDLKDMKLFFKGLFRRSFLVFISIYWKIFFRYFKKNFHWVTLELINFYILIKNIYFFVYLLILILVFLKIFFHRLFLLI
jgi:hypothetical protein